MRGTLTSGLWETVNATYLESRSFSAEVPEAARREFLEWVKYRSHLARGVTIGTMQRDEALYFTRIGTYLERADNTTRMLEARWRDPGGQGERLDEEASEWAVLLRAMSAFETYRRICRAQVTPKQVTELLLMRDDVPQAVHRCLAELQRDLKDVANNRSAETLRRAGELHAQFHYGLFEELAGDGIAGSAGPLPAAPAGPGPAYRRGFPRAPGSRMKRLRIQHTCDYRYEYTRQYSAQLLRLTPRRDHFQRTLAWSIQTPGRRAEQVDAHGNITHLVTVEAPHRQLEVVVTGLVDITCPNNPCPTRAPCHRSCISRRRR